MTLPVSYPFRWAGEPTRLQKTDTSRSFSTVKVCTLSQDTRLLRYTHPTVPQKNLQRQFGVLENLYSGIL